MGRPPRLNDFATHLSEATVSQAETIVWFRGESGDGDLLRRRDLAALLVDGRWRPKMQFFDLLGLEAESVQVEFDMPDVVPFVLALKCTASRLSSQFRALHELTSDELALRMVKLGMSWSIIPLTWNEPKDENLMKFCITGRQPEFVKQPKLAKTKAPTSELDVLCNISEDPVELGRSLASGAAASAFAALADYSDIDEDCDS